MTSVALILRHYVCFIQPLKAKVCGGGGVNIWGSRQNFSNRKLCYLLYICENSKYQIFYKKQHSYYIIQHLLRGMFKEYI